jgi:hypothetical protein
MRLYLYRTVDKENGFGIERAYEGGIIIRMRRYNILILRHGPWFAYCKF